MHDGGRVSTFLLRITEMARLMVGLPDYERYVAHRRRHHPDAPIMSRAEFVVERMQSRYEGGGTGRCC